MSPGDVAQLWQTAPWLAVAVLALFASGWVFRQSGKRIDELRRHVDASNVRQGTRLGDVENRTGLLDLRRRQVEAVLLDEGSELPFWPPDGPDQPRPRRGRHDNWRVDVHPRDVDEDQADEHPSTAYRALPVPPLDPAVASRHRR